MNPTLRPTVRAIILHQGGLVLLRRVKGGRAYYVFPGGGVEEGEANEQALIREVKEEVGVDIVVEKLLLEQAFKGQKGEKMEYFYQCHLTGGEIGTGTGPEFQEGNGYDGEYHVEHVPLSEIAALPLLPERVKELVLKVGTIPESPPHLTP